jgi:hypothetical protein
MKKKFKIGSKYTIQFWDHCLEKEKILCEVTMWITEEDDTHVYGTWWRILTEDSDIEEANREMVSIIKSTIIKKACLKSL